MGGAGPALIGFGEGIAINRDKISGLVYKKGRDTKPQGDQQRENGCLEAFTAIILYRERITLVSEMSLSRRARLSGTQERKEKLKQTSKTTFLKYIFKPVRLDCNKFVLMIKITIMIGIPPKRSADHQNVTTYDGLCKLRPKKLSLFDTQKSSPKLKVVDWSPRPLTLLQVMAETPI